MEFNHLCFGDFGVLFCEMVADYHGYFLWCAELISMEEDFVVVRSCFIFSFKITWCVR